VPQTDPEPLDEFRDDVNRALESGREWAIDLGREHLPRWLIALISGSVTSSVAAILVWPPVVGIACALTLGAATIATYYARRRMYKERRARAWSYIAGKRLERDLLERENRLDQAILVFAGHPQDRALRHALRPQELRQILAGLEYRLRSAAESDRPQPAKATRHGMASRPARAPDLAAVRRRIERRNAQIAAIDAECEQLAVPEDPGAALAASESRDRAHAVYAAALKADRKARELKRRGRRASGRGGHHELVVEFQPDGERNVSRGAYEPSPEELADPDRTRDDAA
jgi:hypothetical protein